MVCYYSIDLIYWAMAGRVVLVFGSAGTVGSGAVKGLLEKAARVVAVSRRAQALEDLRKKLGNPSEDQLVTIQGDVSTEGNAEQLKKDILAKVGKITDVVASIGGAWMTGPVLDQSLEELRKVAAEMLDPQFVAAKTFVPLLADQEGSSYLFITGSARELIFPKAGLVSVYAAGLQKLIEVVIHEHKDKPLRINDFCIHEFIRRDDEAQPGDVTNTDLGKAIANVIVQAKARNEVFKVTKESLPKLIQ